jgi:hypothetical protein
VCLFGPAGRAVQSRLDLLGVTHPRSSWYEQPRSNFVAAVIRCGSMKVRLRVFIAAVCGVVLGEATPVPFVQPLQVSICQLLANPERFSGKEVIIRASIVHPRRLALETVPAGMCSLISQTVGM